MDEKDGREVGRTIEWIEVSYDRNQINRSSYSENGSFRSLSPSQLSKLNWILKENSENLI